MKKFIELFGIIIFLVWRAVAQAATVSPPVADLPSNDDWTPAWHTVGGDPCKENPDCTATWAYGEAVKAGVMPVLIAEQAILAFTKADEQRALGKEPDWQTFSVCEGDVVATAFGQKKLRFVPRIRAAFKGCTEAKGWTYFDPLTGTSYEVFRVVKCGNYSVRQRVPEPLVNSLMNNLGVGNLLTWAGGGVVGGVIATVPTCCTGGGGNPPPIIPPTPPAVVPLPVTIFFLLGALGMFPLCFRRRYVA